MEVPKNIKATKLRLVSKEKTIRLLVAANQKRKGKESFDALLSTFKKRNVGAALGIAALGYGLYNSFSGTGQKKGTVSARKRGRDSVDQLNSSFIGLIAGGISKARGGGFFIPYLVGTSVAGMGFDQMKKQTFQSSLMSTAIAAGAGLGTYTLLQTKALDKSLHSFSTFLERFTPFKDLTKLSTSSSTAASILKRGHLAILGGMIAMPIAHQYAQRKFARQQRRGRRGQDVLATVKAENQAGRPTPRPPTDVATLPRPRTQYRVEGRVRTSSRFDLNGLGI